MSQPPKPYVTFEPEEHIYTLHEKTKQDRILPSVTEIIQDNNLGFDWSVLPRIELAWYGDRGTKVHLACDYLDQGILDWTTVAPEILGYVKSYQLGQHEFSWKVLHSEMLVFDKLHRFAGTLDKILEFGTKWKKPGEKAQADLKSGAPHISHGYQTAGYNIGMDNEMPGCRHLPRYCIYLDLGGGIPKIIPYPDPNDFTIFESAINLTYARRRNNA